MTRESIKSKIAALLAKAEGTDNPFEAETFMAKVNELLEKHQIEMHEIRAAQGDQDPIGKTKGDTNIYASMLWARDLAGALARYYGCRYVYWRKGNHFTYEVVGRESSRITFELMLPYVIGQVRLAARKLDLGSTSRVSRSVLEREVGQALMVRVHRLANSNEEHRVELTGKGLIPVDDLEAAMKDLYPTLKVAKAKKVTYGIDAHHAAQRISLNVQTSQQKTKRIA